MSRRMIIAVFREPDQANFVHRWLNARGYDNSEINVLMSEQTTEFFSEHDEHIKTGSKMSEGMAVGGAVGTAIGATLGAVIALGTAVAIPGLGLVVAGPIIAGLAGGGAGAVTGGILGGLIGLGIPESNAKAYEQALRTGGIVLGVVPHSDKDAKEIERLFAEHGGENVVTATA